MRISQFLPPRGHRPAAGARSSSRERTSPPNPRNSDRTPTRPSRSPTKPTWWKPAASPWPAPAPTWEPATTFAGPTSGSAS